jgi:hypothetical protein
VRIREVESDQENRAPQGPPKKLRGCIAASPNVPNLGEEAYLFFLAFFFAAILFSSPISEIRASDAGGARIQSPCIVSVRSVVKRKVIVRQKK